ncbi:hypothetical protein AB71_1043 [Escherichia coli 1-182-04_S1_C3]|nr:hypothetical protein AB71_1043 [Escherichia coli 1-182-04_S1_C3]EZK32440.1 hypothetical protein AB12_0818 [Escherichia coli 1-182-04_S1_C1]KDA68850.1 hypothetical protein AB40_1797 [Escherichia coli 1-182-04_S1_C2]
MTTITKERLLTIKQWRETYGPGSNVVLPAEEAEELARIALASLEAEPVAYIFKHPAGKLFWALTDESNKEQSDVIPVYAAPPVPVVPAALPENDDEDGHDIDYLEPSEVYALGRTSGWNACRAAMLHSAEPVSQAYKLNALAGNSPVIPDGSADMLRRWLAFGHGMQNAGCQLPHNLIAETEAMLAAAPQLPGSEPATVPGKWIPVSERMPEMGEKQRYVLAADFKNNYWPNIPNTQVGVYGDWFDDGNPTWDDGDGEDLHLKEVTHWMPLPEPPQEVNQ